jgi:diguanylate cyclase (GGDEF)-like protein
LGAGADHVSQTTAILFSPDGQAPPATFRAWLELDGVPTVTVKTADELMSLALRGRPRLVMVDARTHPVAALKATLRLKSDSYTGIVPVVVYSGDDDTAFAAAFDAGADEVLRDRSSASEARQRIDVLLRRSDRDTHVHPSTRLPGSHEIEKDITRRLNAEEVFGVCYADLDHFKEFNDRYSYYDGDRVIRILAQIIHDVVKGTCGERGFVGHIGGDDFIFIVPSDDVAATCGEVVSVFDALVPYQYSEQDRRAGYFFGKDRRGQLHRVPLMTVSIGVVTNERRHFTHAAQISELATEMKTYAKTLPGSVFTVDRRQDLVGDPAPHGARAADLFGGREGNA